jgi:hypothetical protein
MEKIPELVGDLVRVTRVTTPIAGADVAVKKNLLAMRTAVTPAATRVDEVVHEEVGPARMIDRAIVTHCKPWCDRCGGWQAIETVWTDGRVDVACRTCRALMPDQPVGFKPKPEKSTVEGV